MFTPAPRRVDRLRRTFEVPLSSAARDPPAPGRALSFGRDRAAVIRPMGHDHAHVHAGEADARRLGVAFALIVLFMVAEVVAGIIGSSLALLSDAGHMLTDAVALGLALAALRLAERPPAGSFTYGMKRAEILSAQVNGVTLLLFGALIIYEGIRRLIEPPDVEGALVLIVAVVGIWVNLLAARLLAGAERKSLNV